MTYDDALLKYYIAEMAEPHHSVDMAQSLFQRMQALKVRN